MSNDEARNVRRLARRFRRVLSSFELRHSFVIRHSSFVILKVMPVELYTHYKERVIPALKEQRGYTNIHQVPRVEKVVVNTCVGSQQDVKAALDEAKQELALIT